MKYADLKPGPYVLKRDVANPLVDRRKADYDWRGHEVFPKGMLVHLANRRRDRRCKPAYVLAPEVGYKILSESIAAREENEAEAALFSEIVAVMEPAPEPKNVETLAKHMDGQNDWRDPAAILERLVRDKKIALDDVRDAALRVPRGGY